MVCYVRLVVCLLLLVGCRWLFEVRCLMFVVRRVFGIVSSRAFCVYGSLCILRRTLFVVVWLVVFVCSRVLLVVCGVFVVVGC